jgi:hypothetical protein
MGSQLWRESQTRGAGAKGNLAWWRGWWDGMVDGGGAVRDQRMTGDGVVDDVGDGVD